MQLQDFLALVQNTLETTIGFSDFAKVPRLRKNWQFFNEINGFAFNGDAANLEIDLALIMFSNTNISVVINNIDEVLSAYAKKHQINLKQIRYIVEGVVDAKSN